MREYLHEHDINPLYMGHCWEISVTYVIRHWWEISVTYVIRHCWEISVTYVIRHCWEISVTYVIRHWWEISVTALASYVVINVISETKETFNWDFTLTMGLSFNTHHANPVSS